MRFPVVLHTDDGIRFGVTVPDLPGCFSSGDTFDDALVSVVDAIDLHLEGMVEDGEEIPTPGSIAGHRQNLDFDKGVWALVDVDVSRFDGQCEKIDIILPYRLLVKIDDFARTHGSTRSSFFAEAARRVMGGK